MSLITSDHSDAPPLGDVSTGSESRDNTDSSGDACEEDQPPARGKARKVPHSYQIPALSSCPKGSIDAQCRNHVKALLTSNEAIWEHVTPAPLWLDGSGPIVPVIKALRLRFNALKLPAGDISILAMKKKYFM